MNKSEFFKKKVKEFALLNDIKEDIVIRQDNRLGSYLACTELYLYTDTKDPVYMIKYNKKHFKNKSKIDLIALALHELGHIKFKHEYHHSIKTTTIKQLTQMEYEAEKFALLTIKKYYPKQLKNIIKNLKGYKNQSIIIYRVAFTKLAEEFDT